MEPWSPKQQLFALSNSGEMNISLFFCVFGGRGVTSGVKSEYQLKKTSHGPEAKAPRLWHHPAAPQTGARAHGRGPRGAHRGAHEEAVIAAHLAKRTPRRAIRKRKPLQTRREVTCWLCCAFCARDRACSNAKSTL